MPDLLVTLINQPQLSADCRQAGTVAATIRDPLLGRPGGAAIAAAALPQLAAPTIPDHYQSAVRCRRGCGRKVVGIVGEPGIGRPGDAAVRAGFVPDGGVVVGARGLPHDPQLAVRRLEDHRVGIAGLIGSEPLLRRPGDAMIDTGPVPYVAVAVIREPQGPILSARQVGVVAAAAGDLLLGSPGRPAIRAGPRPQVAVAHEHGQQVAIPSLRQGRRGVICRIRRHRDHISGHRKAPNRCPLTVGQGERTPVP